MKKQLKDIAGWYGAGTILLAYILVSFGLISSKSYMFQLLNFTGAIGIVTISFAKKAYQPAMLNLVWMIIALIAIISLLLKT